MGTSNWEAYSVGTNLVASVVGGAGLGWWLDGHFHSGVFLPVLGIGGVIVGFVDLMRTVTRLTLEQEKKAKAERESKVTEGTPQGWIPQGASPEIRKLDAEDAEPKPVDSGATPKPPERVFKVPPPDLPDWSNGPKRKK